MTSEGTFEKITDKTQSGHENCLTLSFPHHATRANARKLLFKINTAIVGITLALCIIMGEGSVEQTLAIMRERFSNILAGLCLTWLLQVISYYYVGTAEFYYCLHDDRVVFHRPPESEEFTIEEIRELQAIPLKPGDFWQSPETASEDRICIAITLKNGREIRITGYLNISAAWQFLASRVSERVTDHSISPKEAFMPLKKLWQLMAIAAFWCLSLYLLLPEKVAISLALLSLACGALPHLTRFYRFGKPTSEKPMILIAYFWLFWFTAAAAYMYFTPF